MRDAAERSTSGPRMDYLIDRSLPEVRDALAVLMRHGFTLLVGQGQAYGKEYMGLEVHGPIYPTTQPCGCLANAQDGHRLGCPDHPEGKGLLINMGRAARTAKPDTEETP